jgi:hypothetical protein
MAANYPRPVKKTLQRRSQKRDEFDSNFTKLCGELQRQQPLDRDPASQTSGFSLNPRISSKSVARRLAGAGDFPLTDRYPRRWISSETFRPKTASNSRTDRSIMGFDIPSLGARLAASANLDPHLTHPCTDAF